MHAWDGWCNYGITENKDIKFVVPKEGSDLWVDTIVVLKNSEHKDAAMKFINFILDTEEPRLGGGEHPLQGAEQGRPWRASTRRSSSNIRTWR